MILLLRIIKDTMERVLRIVIIIDGEMINNINIHLLDGHFLL
jgi:hypothetical protein